MGFYRKLIKPTADFALAAILLLILWPVLLFLFIVNKMIFGQGFFVQTRIGRGERAFKMLKYRSMKIDGNEQSMNAWGRFLRITSLDEWPQLINILRGEMSFVGPRPLLPEYLPHYSAEQNTRHQVKPGITGWAQVNGRNALRWDQSLALDAEYAQKISFVFDFKILLRTVPQILNFGQVQQSPLKSRDSFIKFKEK